MPKPAEQARNLLLWLGQTLSSPEQQVEVDFANLQAIVGASSTDGVWYVAIHLDRAGLLQWDRLAGHTQRLGLTFHGWDQYDRLHRGTTDSKIAFMAMQFNDGELDNVVNRFFRPAVELTGFELRVLTDVPRAGLIDDRLRVEIRQARFLVADLTHRNPGAYWEAGFAEGLGKPVIYTCKMQEFSKASHFDTNHHLTVMWDPDALEQAAAALKATIRATLPDEARMAD